MPRKPQTRRDTTEMRHLKFAEALFRLGNASAALREVYPAANQWSQGSVSKRAYELSKEPTVVTHLEMLREASLVDTVATQAEVTRFLAEVMRGQTTETVVKTCRNPDGSTSPAEMQIPAGIGKRIAAAKQLAEIVGYMSPRKIEVGASAVGMVPQHIEQMSDAELLQRRKEIEG